MNLTKFVKNPFTDEAEFDYKLYEKVVRIFTRMLDNVVEINGLPLEKQREEIVRKRRHGMGYLGLGSAMTMMKMRYGSEESVEFTDDITKRLAIVGFDEGMKLAEEKGAAPIMNEEFGKKLGKDLWVESEYMKRIWEERPDLLEKAKEFGCRFTHHSSIAPTGTIALSLGNNSSNGIEPSFSHQYARNIIREGKKTKEQVQVLSFEKLLYLNIHGDDAVLPDYFIDASEVSPREHVDIQAAAQYWIDSSISKTINVPTDCPFDEFKDIYLYAYEKGLKGCTTFRYNPEAFSGVLVKEEDLANTTYIFKTEDGGTFEVAGNEDVDYDGEMHNAANLYDALKENLFGRF